MKPEKNLNAEFRRELAQIKRELEVSELGIQLFEIRALMCAGAVKSSTDRSILGRRARELRETIRRKKQHGNAKRQHT